MSRGLGRFLPIGPGTTNLPTVAAAPAGALQLVRARPRSYNSTIPSGAHCWVAYGLVGLKAPVAIEDAVLLAAGTNYIYAEITLDSDWAVQTSEIKVAGTMPTNPAVDPATGEAPKTWYYELGNVEVSSGVVGEPNNTGEGSIFVEPYDGGYQYIEPTATQEGGLANITRIRFYRS